MQSVNSVAPWAPIPPSAYKPSSLACCCCRVIAWEPVPLFRAFLTYNRQLNHFEDRIQIRDAAAVDVGGMIYNLTVPQRGIWGTASIGGLNIDRSVHTPLHLCAACSITQLASFRVTGLHIQSAEAHSLDRKASNGLSKAA